MNESDSLPKSYLITFFSTFIIGIAFQISCVCEGFSREQTFFADNVLGPAIFLTINLILFLFHLIVCCRHPGFFASSQRWLNSAHVWYKDLVIFILVQGLSFATLYWVETHLFRGGGPAFNPGSSAMLSLSLEVILLSLYPYFWSLAEEDNLDFCLVVPNNNGLRKAFRAFVLFFTISFDALSYASYGYSYLQGASIHAPYLIIAILFSFLFLGEVALIIKEKFDLVFSYLVIGPRPWKILLEFFLISPMGLSLYYLIQAGDYSLGKTGETWWLNAVVILGVIFVVLPIIFVRGPAIKELAGPKRRHR